MSRDGGRLGIDGGGALGGTGESFLLAGIVEDAVDHAL